MQLNVLENLDSRFISLDRREEQRTTYWVHKQVKSYSVDSVQQPEYVFPSGAVRIKEFKVSFVTKGTREEDRHALLGEILRRGKRYEAKMLLFKLTMEGNPRKNVAS